MNLTDKVKYNIDDLLRLMSYLRTPELGCPWDLKQSYQTIAPSTLEEAYEVVDAIEAGDYSHLKEELGDLLFQVVFYAQLGKEDGYFTFSQIVEALTEKLVRRHPHVFPDGRLRPPVPENEKPMDEAQVKHQWESIKEEERSKKGQVGLMDDVPAALPAAMRALKLQKRAARVGFDWTDVHGVQEKLAEEIDELNSAIESDDQDNIEEEVGDLLFTMINLCRHLKVDPERSLRGANRKFTRRFAAMEQKAREQNRSLESIGLDELDVLWQSVK